MKQQMNNHCIKCNSVIDIKWQLCQWCYDNYTKDWNRDYQLLTTISTPKAIRDKLNIGNIRNNSIKCLSCWDIVRSRNRRDMRYCSCGKCAIDWGSFYGKATGEINELEFITEYYEDVLPTN